MSAGWRFETDEVVGDVLVGLILLAALGAVLIAYFGLQEFTPVTIPE